VAADVLEARRSAETLERELVFGCMASYRFYRAARDIMCPWDPVKLTHRLDFSTGRYNTLYRAIDWFYRRFDNRTDLNPELCLPNSMLAAMIVDWGNRNAVPMSEAEELLNEINEETEFTRSLTYESLHALLESSAFKDWLTSSVLKQTVGRIVSSQGLGALTLDNLEEYLNKAKTATAATTDANYYNAGSILTGRRRILPYIKIPEFGKLNAALGGGLYRGEGTMVAGCNGGGKTILAMQWAKDFAKAGINCMVYTTERRPGEMILRSVAADLEVPLARLSPQTELLSDEVQETGFIPDDIWENPNFRGKLDVLNDAFHQHLLIVDWSQGQGYTIASHLDADVANVERKGWHPDIIMFDWIGGGLDAASDKDKIRLYYQEAADGLINHGKRTGHATIAFAQFDKVKAENRDYVEMNMLSECKTMTNNLTNFIGITSMVDKHPKEGQSPRHRKQYLCVSKATHGPGGKIEVDADFVYQKFRERVTIASGGA
jgi:KaiC